MIDVGKKLRDEFVGIAIPATSVVATMGVIDALDMGLAGGVCLGLACGIASLKAVEHITGDKKLTGHYIGWVGGALLATHGFGFLNDEQKSGALNQIENSQFAAQISAPPLASIPVAMIGDEPFYVPA